MFRAPEPSAFPFLADLLSPMRTHQLLAQRGTVPGLSNKTHPKRQLGEIKIRPQKHHS